LLIGCPNPKTPAAYSDDQLTSKEMSSGKDACALAGNNLRLLQCKEGTQDFDVLCRQLVDAGQPICPVKLSRIKTCEEIESVCR
jgi:hypothetical protein